jgi:hypothetical protein
VFGRVRAERRADDIADLGPVDDHSAVHVDDSRPVDDIRGDEHLVERDDGGARQVPRGRVRGPG